MNWGKLKRKIEREFKRNPAKTGVLLALLPVAMYFIGPLLWKMVPRGAPSRNVAAAVTPAAAPASSIATSSPEIPIAGGALAAWYEIAAAIDKDSRMSPSASKGLRNPFQDDQAEADLTKQETKEPEVSPDAADELSRPEDFGLQLTATIVGSRFRLATINGKQYRENATLTILKTEDGEGENHDAVKGPSFVVKTVDKKFVVLERKGKLYRLQLAR